MYLPFSSICVHIYLILFLLIKTFPQRIALLGPTSSCYVPRLGADCGPRVHEKRLQYAGSSYTGWVWLYQWHKNFFWGVRPCFTMPFCVSLSVICVIFLEKLSTDKRNWNIVFVWDCVTTCFSLGFEYCKGVSGYAWGAAAHWRNSSVSLQDDVPLFHYLRYLSGDRQLWFIFMAAMMPFYQLVIFIFYGGPTLYHYMNQSNFLFNAQCHSTPLPQTSRYTLEE